MEEKIAFLVDWLKTQAKNANVSGGIVGVSGGIDSAVVAHLLKKAYGDSALGVIMPCQSDPSDIEDALSVVQSADIQHVTVDLGPTFETLVSAFENKLKNIVKQDGPTEKNVRLSRANLKARLRMSTLYAISNELGAKFVVGTDNAAEWHTGYFTKYGDGGVDLVPLVRLTKTEVREMAKTLGVPEKIIHKKPSAGLWAGQTDEEEMGTTYEMIDAYLKGEPVPEHDRQLIEALHRKSEHKRRLALAPPAFPQ